METNTDLRTALTQHIVTVTFKKVNGDIRVMDCTTNLNLIPPSAWPKDMIDLTEASKDHAIRVYDVKAQAWRSFIVANVLDTNIP